MRQSNGEALERLIFCTGRRKGDQRRINTASARRRDDSEGGEMESNMAWWVAVRESYILRGNEFRSLAHSGDPEIFDRLGDGERRTLFTIG
jgi:hypothetical protein